MNQPARLSHRFAYRGAAPWRDVRVLRAVAQLVSAVVVVSVLAFFVSNLLAAAEARGISLGFGFLNEAAGFDLGESVIDYDPSRSFSYAFAAGILNTLKVALVGIVAATALGILVGVARLSSNWLVSRLAGAYIEIIRNVPVLVQLFIWHFAVFQNLPGVRESIELPGPIYLNNRGIYLAWASPSPTFLPWLIFIAGGIASAVVLWKTLSHFQLRTGRPMYPLTIAALTFFLIPTTGWFLVGESPLVPDIPVLGRFNFAGGLSLTANFGALLVGLVVYTASFIAEIVRAGIQSVQRGQAEAARALGLTDLHTLRLVIFPQALRVIIPPLISQYLNLTKNSSLAIAIGYPDLFFIGKTTASQAARAVPVFALIMLAYLTVSLTYALIGNIYNRRVRLVER